MPIYSPTGFLDITNATLRTSNVEAENLLMTGGNIYVTSELETDATVLNLENVTRKGNVSSNTIEITNATTGIVATGNVQASKFIGSGEYLTGIPPSAITGTLSQWSDGTNGDVYIAGGVGIANAHTLTSNTLQVGGNLYVRDTGSNVLTVDGNVVANYFEGDGSKLSGIVTDLQGVTDNGNVTTNVVQFSNVTTGLVTTANIEVGGDLKIDGLTAGKIPYVAADKFLKDSFITTTGDTTVITSNLDVTGNIFMRGDKFIVHSESKLINDAIVGIANNNTVSTTDKGIIMQNTAGNVAIIHHGTGDGFANQLTFGYTDDPLDTVTVTNDLTKELTVNVLGNVITQNNLSIGGLLKINTISAASSHSLEAVTNLGNVTSNTVQFSNAITSLTASSNIVVTGNVSAGHNTNTTSYFGRVAVGYMGQDDQASFAHVDHNDPARYAIKQTAAGPTYINTPAAGHIRFTVNDGNAGAEKMRITSAGKVGIGATSPDATLHVAGNAYVSSNLTVSGNVSDLNVVSNVNMLHTANTASIKLNSNVVTEFPRSKKLIKYPRVNLTSASRNAYENGYKVTFSSEYSTSTWAADHVFDSNLTDSTGSWASGSEYSTDGQTYSGGASIGGFSGAYVHLELPVSINLSLVRMLPRTYQVPCPQAPKNYSIIASTDGVTYDLLERVVDEPDTGIFKEIHINTSKSYNRFAIVVEKTIGSHVAAISELEYYGVPEYDPDAHGTDVVVKSVPNVPNTDWLDVYFDAKGLPNGAVTNPISGLGGTTNNGTAAGGLTVSDGVFTFDGTNDSISTTSTATLSFHTASMWIKFEQFSSWAAVYAIRPASLDRNNAFLYANGTENTFRLEALGNTGPYKDFNYTFEPGKWVHLTVLFDGTGLRDSKLYIDGIELDPNGTVRSDTDDITITGTNTVYMGSEPGYYFTGSFANFRLFNRKLTIDEIYQLYAYQKEYFGHGDLSMTIKAGQLGIGTSKPRAALDVRGDVQVRGNIHGGMPVFFDARFTSAPTATEAGTRIVFDTLNNSRGGGFDTSTGIFRAPIAGQYKFSYFMRGNIANQSFKIKPRINGSPTFATTNDGTNQNLLGTAFCGGDGIAGSAVCIVPLEAGGTFELIACTHGGTVNGALASYYSGFTGEYISSL